MLQPPQTPNPPATPPNPEEVISAAKGLLATAETDLQIVSAATTHAANQLQQAVDGIGGIAAAINDAVEHIKSVGLDLQKLVKGLPPPSLPTGIVIGKLNGETFTDPIALRNAIMKRVDNHEQSIEIEWYGPDTVAFRALLSRSGNDLKRYVREVLLPVHIRGILPENAWQGMTPDAFWILLGVACIILAIGVTFVGVCIGLAVLYAVHKNYRVLASNCMSLMAGQVASLCQRINLTPSQS